jgi:flavin-dependent dehydrogenase
VVLPQLEDVLLAEAAAAGVAIERRMAADNDWEPRADRFVIDATGRAGLMARRQGVRVYDEGPRTVALAAVWTHADPWPLPEHSHTVIESYASGWAWSVPTAPGTRHIAVMVDPRRSGLVRGAPARAVYLGEIAKTAVFKGLLATARMVGGPTGWDASGYHAGSYAGDGWLLAGDAGSFIDPLSSAGVKKALASGWLAAVVAHTWLATPALRADALAFFSQREQEIQRHYSRISRSFLAAAAPTHAHAFWRDRSDVPEPAAALDASAVQTAFDELRSARAIALRRGDVRIQPLPCVRGHEIVLESGIIADGESIRFVNGIDIVSILKLAPQFSQVPDLFEAYCRAHGEASLHDFLFALAVAVARRWLVSQ